MSEIVKKSGSGIFGHSDFNKEKKFLRWKAIVIIVSYAPKILVP
jgi:hypothetical protein